MNNKIKVLSTTHEVDNSSDSNRVVAINATVSVKEGKVTEVTRGTIRTLEGGRRIADFSQRSGSRMSVNFNEWEGHTNADALAQVEQFLADCNSSEATEE